MYTDLFSLTYIVFIELMLTAPVAANGIGTEGWCHVNFTANDAMRYVPQCAKCEGRCGTISDFSRGIGCSCDAECPAYHDCCPDFSNICPAEAKRVLNVGLKSRCFRFDGFNTTSYFLLVNTCNGLKCKVSKESPKDYIPVYDPQTRLHFVNAECAECNGVNNIWVWDAVWNCGDVIGGVNSGHIADISHKETKKLWEFIKDRTRQCRVEFSHPEMVSPRKCGPYFPRVCPSTCTNPLLKELCKINDMVYLYDENSGRNYGNIMCFLCNQFESGLGVNLTCNSRFLTQNTWPPPRDAFSFHLLFDFDTRKGRKVGDDNHGCSPNTKWMPSENMCREVINSVKIIQITLNLNITNKKDIKILRNELFKAAKNRFSFMQNLTLNFVKEHSIVVKMIFSKRFNEAEKEVKLFLISYFTNSIDNESTIAYSQPIRDCQAVVYQPDEIIMDENDSVIIKETNKHLKEGDYFIVNETVRICYHEENYFISLDAKSILSIICMGLSILALIVRLCFHLVVPVMDLVVSRMQCCLTMALLLGMSTFLVHPLATRWESLCYIVAVVIHWAFLAAFSWMTVIGFDILRMLRISFHLQHLGSRRKSFIVYSIFAWCLPTLIVIVSLVIDLDHGTIDKKWKSLYGKSICWISNRFALIIYFGVPSGALFLANIIMFVLSVIYTHKGKKGGLIQGQSVWLERLMIHFKLLGLMGLTWVIGFLAAPLNIDALWYTFILLSASQGIFMLVTYVTSRNVREFLNSDSCCGKYKRHRDSSGSGTASSSL